MSRSCRASRLLLLLACLLVLAPASGSAANEPNPVVGRLVVALRSNDDRVRAAAAAALGKTGDPLAVEPLIVALKDKRIEVAKSALASLGEIGDPRAVAPVVEGVMEWRWGQCPDTTLAALGSPAVGPVMQCLREGRAYALECCKNSLKTMSGPALEPLLAALKDPAQAIRTRVVEVLGGIKDPRAVDALIAAIGDESIKVRLTAVAALGGSGDPRAVSALAAILGDGKDPGVVLNFDEQGQVIDTVSPEQHAAGLEGPLKVAAARALGQIGGAAVEPLLKALESGSGLVRATVAETLGGSGDPRVVAPLVALLGDDDQRLRSAAANALGRTGDRRAVEPLIAGLRDSDREVRSTAAHSLGLLKDGRAATPLVAWFRGEPHLGGQGEDVLDGLDCTQAVGPLIAALRDETAEVRLFAARALGRIRDPRAAKALLDARLDSDPPVRAKVLEALAAAGDPRAFSALLDALSDPETTVVAAAASALGESHDPRALEPLLKLLKDERRTMIAFAALTRMKTAAAVEPLLGLLEPGSRVSGQAVADALAGIGEPAVAPLLKAVSRGDRSSVPLDLILEKIGEPAVGPLIETLKSPDPALKTRALKILGGIKSPRAAAALAVFASGPDNALLTTAVEALGNQGAAAVEPLIALLRHRSNFVRWSAIRSLGRTKDPRGAEVLIGILGEGAREQRAIVQEALSAIDPLWMLSASAWKAGEGFLADLSSPDVRTRSGAANALGIMRDPRAVEPLLLSLLGNDAGLRHSAIDALRAMDREPLLFALVKGSAELRIAAAVALGEMQDQALVEPLSAALQDADPRVRRAAVEALSRIDPAWRDRPNAR